MALGRTLIILGLVIVAAGLLLSFSDRLPIHFGRLPGDFKWRGKNSVVYFPLATSILLSVLLSIVMWLFSRR
ncbi:MAG TPA: DUF2905 domain-containing protein [Bryobacteraceae bacterium]|nr:DUF2905 domain-containing protein [Bryobacteraceae bacterium]